MRALEKSHPWALAAFILLAAGCASAPKTAQDESIADAQEQIMAAELAAEAQTSEAVTSAADAVDTAESQVQAAQAEAMNKLREQTTFYFDFDKANVKLETQEVLKAHAKYLIDNPFIQVRLAGHADERGTREYNMALGEQRAQAVAKFLRINGVPNRQLEVVSYGEEEPAVMGNTEAAWSKNRRVELSVKAQAPF